MSWRTDLMNFLVKTGFALTRTEMTAAREWRNVTNTFLQPIGLWNRRRSISLAKIGNVMMWIETLVPTRMEHAQYEIVQRVTYTGMMQATSCAIALIVPKQTSTNAVPQKAIAIPTLVRGVMCTDRIQHHLIAIAPASYVLILIEIFVATLSLLAIHTKPHTDTCWSLMLHIFIVWMRRATYMTEIHAPTKKVLAVCSTARKDIRIV
jgi:hypothetical protein